MTDRQRAMSGAYNHARNDELFAAHLRFALERLERELNEREDALKKAHARQWEDMQKWVAPPLTATAQKFEREARPSMELHPTPPARPPIEPPPAPPALAFRPHKAVSDRQSRSSLSTSYLDILQWLLKSIAAACFISNANASVNVAPRPLEAFSVVKNRAAVKDGLRQRHTPGV